MFQLLFTRQAKETIQSLPTDQRKRLGELLQELATDPFGLPYQKIQGESNVFRVRMGKFRIVYEIDTKNNTIFILKFDKRSRVYQ